MSETTIFSAIVEPFWVWMVLLLSFGFAGALLGLLLSWVFTPIYRTVHVPVYSPVNGAVAPVSGDVSVGQSKRPSWLQRIREWRRNLQPIVEVEAAVEWKAHSNFFRSWHHAKYRGFLKREYNIKLPKKGRVVVYSHGGKYAVKHEGAYYIIPWK